MSQASIDAKAKEGAEPARLRALAIWRNTPGSSALPTPKHLLSEPNAKAAIAHLNKHESNFCRVNSKARKLDAVRLSA